MRHVVIDGPGSVLVADAPDPVPPGAGGAVVTVDAASICGSDLHYYDGDIPVGEGFAVGHELIGTVVEVGADVRRFRSGDRVLAASVTGCGHCDGCATGDPITCVDGPKVFGSGGLGGGQATAVAVPAADFQLLRIPEGVDDEAALLLTDNLNTGWIGAKRADFRAGAAPSSCSAWARSGSVRCGPRWRSAPVGSWPPTRSRVGAIAAPTPVRSPIEGPTVDAVLAATDGRGADAVIDAVATDTTLTDALTCVRPGGTVSVVGVHDLEPYPLPVLMGLFRSVTLRLTTAPVHQTWPELVPLVVNGRLRTDGIFTHRFPLDEAAAAYAAVAARAPDCVKVMLVP